MVTDLQTNVKKLDDKLKAKKIVIELKSYMNRYIEADKEYCRIPSWRFLKQMKNIRKREKLNRDFKVKMIELEVFV